MYLINLWIHKVRSIVLAVAGSLVVGCATQFSLDLGDPCAAERSELRGAQNYYTQAIVGGALLGAVTGGLAGWLAGKSEKSVAAGAALGAVVGGVGGYYLAKQKVAADAAALSDSILKDVQTDNTEIDKATLAFAKLRNCRFTAAQQVKSDFAAGRISRTQAISRLDELRERFTGDLAIADEVGTKMADRSREFDYASNQLVAENPEAKSYLASYPMTPAESITPPTASKAATTHKLPTTHKPVPVAPRPPVKAKAPPPKAAPVVAVAQETNTNQIKQKKYSNEVAVAKAESSKAFSLEGQVGLILPPCLACGSS